MTAYENACFLVGDALMQMPRTLKGDIVGAMNVLEQYDDIQLIPVVNMFANPSGPVTKEVYSFVEELLIKTIREQGPIDAVMITFHGAMVAENHPDAEGDLLEMLRDILGWQIPIVASLDLHANVTEKMAHCANALVSFREYPHVDVYDVAAEAAQILADALHDKVSPTMAYRRIPHLMPLFPTENPQIRPLYDLEVFRRHGITPTDMRLLVVKSSIHYRATYGTVARAMYPIPVPGYIDPRPETFPFRTWKG